MILGCFYLFIFIIHTNVYKAIINRNSYVIETMLKVDGKKIKGNNTFYGSFIVSLFVFIWTIWVCNKVIIIITVIIPEPNKESESK